MKLYYTPGACSLVVRIIIHEIGLPAQFESVDLKIKKTESGTNFLTINPKGAVPTLQLDNQEILTENAVILQYLADSAHATQLLPPITDFKRYRVLEWLNYTATELHKTIGSLFNPAITDAMKTQFFVPLIQSKFKYLDEHLQTHRYLLGDTFTLPDAYVFVVMRWAQYFKLDLTPWNHLTRYLEELNSRKSIQQSLQEEK